MVDLVEAHASEDFVLSEDDGLRFQLLYQVGLTWAEGRMESSEGCNDKLKSTLMPNAIMD